MTISQDTNVAVVELAARELGALMDQLVLVGGCAVGLLVTDPARPPVRQTIDVDLLTGVTPISNYYKLCEQLRKRGFKESPLEPVICRWRKGDLLIDIMPADEKVLQFTNAWYTSALKTASEHTLPSSRKILLIDAPHFLATKLAAFASRGNGDYLHHDIEDLITVIDGRETVVVETQRAQPTLRDFLMGEMDDLLADEGFVEKVSWHLASNDQFRKDIVLSRIRKIAGI